MQLKEKIAASEASVLYFKGANCSTCHVLEPKVKELIKTKFPKIEYLSIESEKEEELTAQYRIFSSPVILVLFDGRETIRKGRTTSIPELEQEIERYYNLYFS